MPSNFSEDARKAADYTREGLQYLVEINELQESIDTRPKDEEYIRLVREIAEKEKMAVSLIQQATLLQRGLLNSQHKRIEALLAGL